MDLVGELVLERNRLLQLSRELKEIREEEFKRSLLKIVDRIDLITTELQFSVLKTRMLPVGRIFKKFPRLVRDLARDLNKEVELVISGEETELDRSVMEEIKDALVHLVRNAIDHGIESPQERERAGKPRRGVLHLTATQQGDHICIQIADDGRGIHPQKVAQKALERGLLTQEDLNRMSAKEIINLIFTPGFSTAEGVTELSGRGVGMDVVKATVKKLKGGIDVDSRPGKGCRITLKLPLTTSVIRLLVVEVSGRVFALPLSSVLEVIRVRPGEVSTINHRQVIRYRDSVLPLVDLNSSFQKGDYFYVVVVGFAKERVGLRVTGLLGQQEAVMKPLGDYLNDVPGIIGSAITGDGRVMLILDVAELMNMSNSYVSYPPN